MVFPPGSALFLPLEMVFGTLLRLPFLPSGGRYLVRGRPTYVGQPYCLTCKQVVISRVLSSSRFRLWGVTPLSLPPYGFWILKSVSSGPLGLEALTESKSHPGDTLLALFPLHLGIVFISPHPQSKLRLPDESLEFSASTRKAFLACHEVSASSRFALSANWRSLLSARSSHNCGKPSVSFCDLARPFMALPWVPG